MDNEPIEPRKRVGEIVAEAVAAQREQQLDDLIYEQADADPVFDTRAGHSNFGARLSSKIQRALRES